MCTPVQISFIFLHFSGNIWPNNRLVPPSLGLSPLRRMTSTDFAATTSSALKGEGRDGKLDLSRTSSDDSD